MALSCSQSLNSQKKNLKRNASYRKTDLRTANDCEDRLRVMEKKAQVDGWSESMRKKRVNTLAELLREPNLVKERVRDFFKDHFKIVHWKRPTINRLNLKQLGEEEKVFLERSFTEEEVWEAVCNCDGNKAPGLDVLSIVKELNKTFIALIPKCGKPNVMKDYRPISLVGSIYKVLANRLKQVMNYIIGEFQMASMKNRQILDSFVVAEEIIQMWKKG
ncbi:hypothetical protein Dsin_013209 [Dipteronia sinensis]|uniref:Reverse transcriptase domain-containing protein n=1 Tax=Dipteronia sinensis TaxID=43782 RepID=A0AAE0AKU0_9ROSI|nr:hypothetical protein Dsin_013209 [Dipteronia sinensis]